MLNFFAFETTLQCEPNMLFIDGDVPLIFEHKK
jgi:hypothetical protein